MANNRAFRFRAYVSVGGKSFPLHSGQVEGRIGAPSRATVNVPYQAVGELFALQPFTVSCELGRTRHTLFEGQLTALGRDKHERNRSITLIGEGLSNVWFRTCLYQINELSPSGLNFGDAFRARSVGDPTGYNSGKRVADLSNLLQGDLPGFIKSVLARTGGVGGQALARTKILSDTAVTALFTKGDTARRIIMKMVEGQTSQIAPVMTYLRSIMDLLYYEMVDMVGPAPGGRILFKPRLLFAPAPGCNVFLPKNYSFFRESRSLVDAPTRMMFQTNAFLEPTQSGSWDIGTLVRFAPPQLQAAFSSIDKAGFRDPATVTSLLSNAITPEESLRGIVAEYGAISPAEWLITGGGGTMPADEALGKMAEYKLRLKQLEYRSAVVNHCFAPNVAVGFPGVIVDDKFTIRGLVSGVSHSFSVDGVSTQISLSHTQLDGEGLGADNPAWVSNEYASGSAYASLTGFGPAAI